MSSTYVGDFVQHNCIERVYVCALRVDIIVLNTFVSYTLKSMY